MLAMKKRQRKKNNHFHNSASVSHRFATSSSTYIYICMYVCICIYLYIYVFQGNKSCHQTKICFFVSQIVLYFLHSTSILSFYIDIVLTLCIINLVTSSLLFKFQNLKWLPIMNSNSATINIHIRLLTILKQLVLIEHLYFVFSDKYIK